jgi:hypothetical protein
MWLLALPLVAYLPGALIFRAPVASRERRAGLDAEERVFWAVVLSVAWSSVSALALAAASRYSLTALLGVNAAVSAAAALGWRGRLLFRGTAPRPRMTVLAPLALLALGLALYFPVAEYVIGGKDPGIYVNEGIALAQRGSFVIRDPVVAAVPAAARDMFFPNYQAPDYYSLRFMGFFVLDPAQGTVIGQFPHLYPAWVAIGYGLDGVIGALGVIGVLAVLGLLAVYFAGARLLGRLPALAATALLAVSVVEVWFARYPNSEVMLQALLFAGLLAFSRAFVDDDAFFGPVAGVLLGMLVCLRIDAILAWAGVALAVVLLQFRQKRLRIGFLVGAAASAGASLLYLTAWMGAYLDRPKVFLRNLQPQHLALIAAGMAGVLALLAVARNRRIAAAVTKWAPHVVSLVVIAAAIYAYFFRAAGGRLAEHDAAAFRTFTWYVPWAGLVAAVAGFALVSWRKFWRDPALLLVITVYSFFVFYKIQIVPEHFWMTRRFVAVILPAAFVLMAGAAFFAWWNRGDASGDPGAGEAPVGCLHLALPLACVAFMAVLLVRASEPVMRHVEYRGLTRRVERFSERFTPRDLVVFEPRRSSDIHIVALPLAYIHGRNVLVLNTPRPDRRQFEAFVAWARGRYENVYFAGSGGSDLLSRSVAVAPVAADRFPVPEYESAWNAYPTGPRQKKLDFTLYRFVDPPAVPGPIRIDVGSFDDLNVLRFNAKELLDGRAFRWTNDVSYVSIVRMGARATTLTLTMGDGGRPANAPRAAVTCYLDDRLIGETTVQGGFQPYRFGIPPEVAAAAAGREDPAQLRIVTATWNPKTALGAGDDRQLGVMLARVEVQ